MFWTRTTKIRKIAFVLYEDFAPTDFKRHTALRLCVTCSIFKGSPDPRGLSPAMIMDGFRKGDVD